MFNTTIRKAAAAWAALLLATLLSLHNVHAALGLEGV